MLAIFALLALAGLSQAVPQAAYYAPAATLITKTQHTPVYATAYQPYVYKAGVSHHAVPVTEHRFSRVDYETPGALYQIPAVRTVAVTKPGFTTYKTDYITQAHVSNHVVAGPSYSTPIVKPVVSLAAAPIAHAPIAVAHAPLAVKGYY